MLKHDHVAPDNEVKLLPCFLLSLEKQVAGGGPVPETVGNGNNCKGIARQKREPAS